MTDPIRFQAPGPVPGEVVATIEVPVQAPEDEQQAVDTAVANGGLIALVLVIGLVISFLGWLWKQMVVRILGAAAIAAFITVMIMRGSR